jgi:predicted esterase
MREFNVPVTTHGRVLIEEDVERDGATASLKLLVGCHGYAQSADEMMEMLGRIPSGDGPAHRSLGGGGWTRVSIQALHRFYRGRSQITVASWMTSQDRELMIADNVAYVDAAIARVAGTRAIERLVFCGFSQGVAMAFRAAVRGAARADAVLALGGDVPPELLADAGAIFPRVLLARGTRDEWYAAAKLEADEASLRTRGAAVETLTFDGAHEWHPDFAERAATVLRQG